MQPPIFRADIAALSANVPGNELPCLRRVVTGQQLLAISTAGILTVGFELVRRGTLFGKISVTTATDPEW